MKSANIKLMTKVTNLRNTVQTQFKISVYRILVGTAIVIGQHTLFTSVILIEIYGIFKSWILR